MDNQSSTKGLVSTAPHTKTSEMKENKEAKKEPENTLNQSMAFQGALDEKKKKMKRAKKETEKATMAMRERQRALERGNMQ